MPPTGSIFAWTLHICSAFDRLCCYIQCIAFKIFMPIKEANWFYFALIFLTKLIKLALIFLNYLPKFASVFLKI